MPTSKPTTCNSSAHHAESFHATVDEFLLYVLAQDILERGKKSRQAMQQKSEDDDARERTRLSRARLAASPLGTFFLKSRDRDGDNVTDKLFDRDGCLRLLAEARHVAYVIIGASQHQDGSEQKQREDQRRRTTCSDGADESSKHHRREEKKDNDRKVAWDIIDLVPVRLSPPPIAVDAAAASGRANSGCSAGANDDCMSVSELEENHLAEVATFLTNCLVPGDQHIVGVIATPPISYAPSSSTNSLSGMNDTNNKSESDIKKKAQEEAKINVKTAILTSAFLRALQTEIDTMTALEKGDKKRLALVQASIKPSQLTTSATACATTAGGKNNDGGENKDWQTKAGNDNCRNKGMMTSSSCCTTKPAAAATTSGNIKFIAHLADSGEAFIFPSHSHSNQYEDRRGEGNKSSTNKRTDGAVMSTATSSTMITTIPAYVTIRTKNASLPSQTTAKTDENGGHALSSSAASSSRHELIRFCCPLSKWTSLVTEVKGETIETPQQQNEIWRVSSKLSSDQQPSEHGGPRYIPISKGSTQTIKLPPQQRECSTKGEDEEKGKTSSALPPAITNIEPLTFGPTAAPSGSSLVYVPIFVRRNACRGEGVEISTHFVEEALRAVARGANEYATRTEETEDESRRGQLLLHQSPRITYAGIIGSAIFWNGLGVLGDYFTDESTVNNFTSLIGSALSLRSSRSKTSTLLRSTSALPKISDDGNSSKPDSTKKRTTTPRRRDCILDNTLIQLIDTIFAPKALPCLFSSARSELIAALHSSGGHDDQQCGALLNGDFYFYGSSISSIEGFAVPQQPSAAGGGVTSDDITMKRPRACCGPPIDPNTKPFSARVFNLISLALFTMTMIGSYLILSSPTY